MRHHSKGRILQIAKPCCGEGERYLVIKGEDFTHYQCSYFNRKGEYVRDGVFRKDGRFSCSLTLANPGWEAAEDIKAFMKRHNMLAIESLRCCDEEAEESFLTVWVPGSDKPVTCRYSNIKEATEACRYLIEDKGIDKVFIMGMVGVVEKAPSISVTIGKKRRLI